MITSILAGLLSIFYFKISLDVISQRKSQQVSLGNGENNTLLKYTSAHSNFSAYVPLLLILFYLNEISGMISHLVLIPLALIILVGRILHFVALTSNEMNFSYRTKGMKLTLFPILIMSISLIVIQGFKLF